MIKKKYFVLFLPRTSPKIHEEKGFGMAPPFALQECSALKIKSAGLK
jgi:hypothetical protein